MPGLWNLGILVLALALVRPLTRIVIALVGGRKIGDAALARQPDTIHLVRAGDTTWKHADKAAALAQPLLGAGFRDAGIYVVDEMPGVVVQLLVEPAAAFMACIYEHPKAGYWVDVAQSYEGGGGHTVSSMPDPGLDARPGYTTDHMPQASSVALLARAKSHVAAGAPMWIATDQASQRFEQVYAESIAWRKQHGVSRREVVNVAMKKAA
jgi:hypothetical protein